MIYCRKDCIHNHNKKLFLFNLTVPFLDLRNVILDFVVVKLNRVTNNQSFIFFLFDDLFYPIILEEKIN